LINSEQAKNREEIYRRNESIGSFMFYFKYLKQKLCIDSTFENNIFSSYGRLISHSMKDSNIKPKLIICNEKPTIFFFARKNIAIGEELTFDYGEKSKTAISLNPWLKF
jgi:histone-lysine N-methyltransferase SETD8